MIKVSNERYDEKTNEYVYDVEIDPKELEQIEKMASEHNMTVEQFCSYCVEYAIKNPDTLKELIETTENENKSPH